MVWAYASDGFTTLTVPDHVLEPVLKVMTTYQCGSLAKAVSVDATVALERDEPQLARILSDLPAA